MKREQRHIYHWEDCGSYFSETKNTALQGLRTSLGGIIMILDALNDGLGINAASRVFKVSTNRVYRWLKRLARVKGTLLLYALCHQFLQQVKEMNCKVNENKPPAESEGWTIVLMNRATRFIWELKCGKSAVSLKWR